LWSVSRWGESVGRWGGFSFWEAAGAAAPVWAVAVPASKNIAAKAGRTAELKRRGWKIIAGFLSA
jgi:hypothetical protein